MEQFLNKYQDQITGCISVFDRIIFKGNLPISYPKAAEGFLFNQGVLIKDFRHFTGEHTDILKQHAQKMAADAGRPYEYHRFKTRKDDYALKMAQRDGITDGLICVIARNMEYYWVTDQAEYATDVMIGNSTWLDELYIKWQKHAAVCFQAEDIMTFMGRKLHSSFNSTIVTNVKKRPSVTRIKHGVGG